MLWFTAAASARFTLYCSRGLIDHRCLHQQQDGHLPYVLGPDGLVVAVRSCFHVVYVSDVDVSIIDKTATLLSLMDPSVPSPLYGLASIHVVYVSPVDVDVSIIDRTDTLPSSMGPPVLLPLFVRPRGLTLSRSRSPNAVLTASGWMDGWMDG
jgi:hypothetical protein